MRPALIFLILLNCICAQGQEIPIGTWRSHFGSNQVNHITTSSTAVFGATSNAVLIYDPLTAELTNLNKVSGLSSVGLSDILYHQRTETLMVAYQDGNLDFVAGNDVINNPSLLQASNINQKGINGLISFGESAIVAADFGVLVVNPAKGEILESWVNIGANGSTAAVKDAAISLDSIFLNTDQGILKASRNDGSNLKDFRSWSVVQGLSNVSHIAYFNGRLYGAADAQGLFQYQDGNWTLVSNSYSSIKFLKTTTDRLLILADEKAISLSASNQISEIADGLNAGSEIAMYQSSFWLADLERGLVNLSDGQITVGNGPTATVFFGLRAFDNLLLSFPGGYNSVGQATGNLASVEQFAAGLWSTTGGLESYSDFVDGIYESSSARYTLASFSDGVLVKDEQGLQVWNAGNSTLQFAPGSQQTKVSAIALDETTSDRYVANYDSDEPIHQLKPDGTWNSFAFTNSAARFPVELEIDQFGQLFARLGISGNGGILVFDPQSGQSKVLNQTLNNGGIISNRITSIALDQEDELWIGTDKGPVFIPLASSILSFNEVNAIRPIFESNFLLKDEKVNDIEIDPGNRKWIATDRGAWLFDEDGENLFYQFNSQNSPLPSDLVLDISVLPNTGEVFFLTDLGTVSFRADASLVNPDQSQVEVFPNPVRPDYNGLLGIRGVSQDAILKITDSSGRLVRELRAFGNSASWDLRDSNGSQLSTGVYLIFSSDEAGENGVIGKVAIIR